MRIGLHILTMRFNKTAVVTVLVFVVSGATVWSQTPSKQEIGKLCVELLKQKFRQPRSFGLLPLSALSRIEEGINVAAVRNVSESEIVAKFEVTLTYLNDVAPLNFSGLPPGRKGEKVQKEEECTLFKYDTGWRAEKIAGMKGREDSDVRKVPLAVTRKTVGFKPLLYEPIRGIISATNFAVFSNRRQIWIKEAGQKLTLLSDLLALPTGFNWYGTLCPAGDRVAVSVGRYPEELRHEVVKGRRGEYIGGPEPVGVLVFTPRTAKLVSDFRVESVHARLRTGPPDIALPAQVRPLIQSCQWDGSALIVGAYGLLARLDLEKESALLLDCDDCDNGLQVNRTAIFAEGDVLWVSVDEGGIAGGCIDRFSNEQSEEYCLLGYNNRELDPDAILRYKGRLLTSSLAGVVEIDERRKGYVHYQLSAERTQMPVFRLSVLNGELWGGAQGWLGQV